MRIDRPIVGAQDAANHVLIDFNTESQRDLLGDARAAPGGVTPFHLNNCVDELSVRSPGARSMRVPG